MELVKRKITLEDRKQSTKVSVSVDEDVFLPDQLPEADCIVGKKCRVQLEEPQTEEGQIHIKGKLLYELMIQGESAAQFFVWKGAIPFSEEERLYGEVDEIELQAQMEDFSPELIHSKKVNVRALFSICVTQIRLIGQEAAVDLDTNGGKIEVLKKKVDLLELVARKKDVIKVKQEVTLPNNNPDIAEILWTDVSVRALDYRPKDGKIAISGEIAMFVLYRAEGMENEIASCETVVPFSDYPEMSCSREGMIVELLLRDIESQVTAREDFDGETRILQLELAMQVTLRMYEDQELEVMEDVYGMDREISGLQAPMQYQKLLYIGEGKKKVVDQFPYDKGIQLVYGSPVHVEGEAAVENIQTSADGVTVDGFLSLHLLCREQKEGNPYILIEGQVPFQYQIPAKGGTDKNEDVIHQVSVEVEQISVHFATEGMVEVRAILNVRGYIYEMCEESAIQEIKEAPLDPKKVGELPGICIYYPKEGESVWEIGKKYNMPISQIKEQNHLVREKFHQGEKLLLMKSVAVQK